MAFFPVPRAGFALVATGSLAIAGGAVAAAALADLGGPARASRVGITVQTVKVDGEGWAIRTGDVSAAVPEIAVPPSGRFAAASADATVSAFAAFDLGGDAAGEPAGHPVVGAARFDEVFQAFDGASARFTVLPVATAPTLAFRTPRRKPTETTGEVQVASLAMPAPAAAARPNAPAEAAPILAEGMPRKMPKGAAPYLDIIKREAAANGVPVWVPLGVIWVESKYDPNLRGTHSVVGLMQVMPSTARYLGYRGSNQDLLKPEVNVKWGMKELAKDLQYAKGELCLAVAKYKGGFMTKTINAGARRYCDQLRAVTGMDGVNYVKLGAPLYDTKTAYR